MIDTTVSPFVRKLAAVGLALAVLIVAFGFLIEPAARRVWGLAATIEERREHLGRLEALARGPANATDVAGIRRALVAATWLEGETEAIRLANLQRAVRQVADKVGIRLRSTQTLPTTPRDDLAQLGLQATAQATLPSIQRFLYGLETHRPMLIVEALELQPLNTTGTGQDGREERALQMVLRVRALTPATEKGGIR